MHIRNSTPDDLLSIVALLKATNLYWEVADTPEAFFKKIQHDHESVLVLEENDTIIGAVFFIYDPWISFIWHLVIDPTYQGKGLAWLLVEEVEHRLRARGTTSIVGYVAPSNIRSLAFIKKQGYELYVGDLVVPVAKIL